MYLKDSLRILSESANYMSLIIPSLIFTVQDIFKAKSLRQEISLTTSSNKCIKSDLQVFRNVPSSWNKDKGIGPNRCAKIFSMFTSSESRTFKRAKAWQKINKSVIYYENFKKNMKGLIYKRPTGHNAHLSNNR